MYEMLQSTCDRWLENVHTSQIVKAVYFLQFHFTFYESYGALKCHIIKSLGKTA